MGFRDIKGQERAVEFFRSSFNKNKLAHAYLFLGPEGVGRAQVAQNLAKFLNCENPQKDGRVLLDCCDRCTSCRKIDGNNFPDLHWVARLKGHKEISIDEIRAVQKEIALKPYEGRFKVFIIQDAGQMSEEAANCLLKTLEEPPSFSIIILTSTNISELLPTIISRCQIIRFYLLRHQRLKEILIKDYKVESDDAHFLSLASEGRLGRALSLKEKDAKFERNRLIDQASGVLRQTWAQNIFNIKDRQELAIQVRYLLNWFRDILVFKAGLATSYLINADRMEKIKSSACSYTFEDLEQIITKIYKAHRLIEQNVNPKIALEVMLGGIAKCKK